MATTIRDVALKAGTSVAAASHALNGRRAGSIRIGEETRKRIIETARALGYVPHPIAKSLATGKTRSIGLVLPYANAFVDQNPFCAHVMHGVFQAAVCDHYNLMLFTGLEESDPSVNRGPDFTHLVDGVVLVLPDPQSSIVERIQLRRIPCVAVVSFPLQGITTVNADDLGGGFIATRHLLGLGHTRISFLAGQDIICTSAARKEGYFRALRLAGIEPDPQLIVQAGFDTKEGSLAAKELLTLRKQDRPTAIVAANDLCANGAMMALADAGIRVPEDVAIVGYDDTEFCETTRPTLTSVNMAIDDLGLTAVRRLESLIDGNSAAGENIVLPVSLTIRNSCGGKTRGGTREQSAGLSKDKSPRKDP